MAIEIVDLPSYNIFKHGDSFMLVYQRAHGDLINAKVRY